MSEQINQAMNQQKNLRARDIIFGDKLIKTAAIVCILSMGGFMGWSAFAPMAEGVPAFGNIVVDNNRKVVQHLEGGIIEEIMVREGDLVTAGQPLVVLTDVAAFAGRDSVAQEMANFHSSIDRLNALLDGKKVLEFTPNKDIDITAPQFAETLSRQKSLFLQQQQTLSADIDVLFTRKGNFSQNANNRQSQIDSLQRALELVQKDLKLKRGYLIEKLIQADQVAQVEREEARLLGEVARLNADQQNDRLQVKEIEREIIQAKARFNEKITGDLLESRAKVSELSERLLAAQDVVNRTAILAPQAGVVLNLKFTTNGGVLRPGDTILEIVPSESELVAVVQVSPSDRDTIYEGLTVKTRLSGLHSWQMPSLDGVLSNISADLKTSPNGEFSYYEARVTIDAQALSDLDIKVIPGMPVEAFISSGKTRTLFDYLFEPLSAIMRRGARS